MGVNYSRVINNDPWTKLQSIYTPCFAKYTPIFLRSLSFLFWNASELHGLHGDRSQVFGIGLHILANDGPWTKLGYDNYVAESDIRVKCYDHLYY